MLNSPSITNRPPFHRIISAVRAAINPYLPKILNADMSWCQGYSEPEAGSDLASVRTRAVSNGDDYLVTGSKIWTSAAEKADYIFALVRTDPDAKPQLGISFLLIDTHEPRCHS